MIGKEKETEEKLMMKMKKRQRSGGGSDRKDDRLSDLPDCVLLHIMKFMDIKHAVQTCVLSKRWKNLWKHLTNLTLHSSNFSSTANFHQFVSQVLFTRDDSISLHCLDFRDIGMVDPKLLDKIIKYAVLHNVQKLKVETFLWFRHNFEFPHFLFSCRSLTSLKFFTGLNSPHKLPKSLQLPALKSLHLRHVTFTASNSGSDYAEPFSTCNQLDTLVITNCLLDHDVKFLCISNSMLSSLTIYGTGEVEAYKIAFSTPNLSSLTIKGVCNHQFSSTCKLSLLQEVNIHTFSIPPSWKTDSFILSCLQLLSNVKIMTLSSHTLELILQDLSNPNSKRTQPPCFVRLESLKVKMDRYARVSKAEVKRAVEYLLQNSRLAKVDVKYLKYRYA